MFRSTEAGAFFRSGKLKYSLPLFASNFVCTSHSAVPFSETVSFASAVPSPLPATTPSTPADFSQLTSVPSEDIRERRPSPNSIVPENFQASFAASNALPASSCPAKRADSVSASGAAASEANPGAAPANARFAHSTAAVSTLICFLMFPPFLQSSASSDTPSPASPRVSLPVKPFPSIVYSFHAVRTIIHDLFSVV